MTGSVGDAVDELARQDKAGFLAAGDCLRRLRQMERDTDGPVARSIIRAARREAQVRDAERAGDVLAIATEIVRQAAAERQVAGR
ncbi:MAG TPA: hypothetical protein VGW74_10530 [Propionibacteriaceae bacterium]|nr:hypothetical protein [Propionibacteriaceae bacterium]